MLRYDYFEVECPHEAHGEVMARVGLQGWRLCAILPIIKTGPPTMLRNGLIAPSLDKVQLLQMIFVKEAQGGDPPSDNPLASMPGVSGQNGEMKQIAE